MERAEKKAQISQYIDKRIADFKKRDKWKTKITDTSHDDFIKDFNTCLLTNVIRDTFTKRFLKLWSCADCGGPSQERCHGLGEERGIMLRRALERVYPDTTKVITLNEIVYAFLEEHKNSAFTFKCSQCHKNEKQKKSHSDEFVVVRHDVIPTLADKPNVQNTADLGPVQMDAFPVADIAAPTLKEPR